MLNLMKFKLLFLLLLLVQISFAQYPVILSQREQARVIDELLEDRLRNVLPGLMRNTGIDMWVVISREYNEDPIIETLLPATWFAARRTTMLVMFDRGNGAELEYLAVARYDVGKVFKRAWDPDAQPDQWLQLAKIIEERNPKKIAVNKSVHVGLADGITANDYEQLLKSLKKNFQGKVVSAEPLSVAWLETRSEKEMAIYPQICRIAHNIIQEGFSEKVIHPGITTTDDVVWWYREKIKELKLDTWFQPSVSISRNESDAIFTKRPTPVVIQPGDLLHVDFGITYLRLNTDTQQHAYVLKPGETDAPDYLKKALAIGNRLQDILTGQFALGKSGNEVLAAARAQAIHESIVPSIYTHPIGFHGHAAGTTIGMWDMQQGVPHNGDYTLHYKTAYSIELNATVKITEWNKEIQIKLEEDGYFDESGFRYIDGRQKELLLVQTPSSINRQ
ncbi:M24 family metallopeptidase [Chryseotalea sanaruensis]|uniref:M24 family metallopeptidase n=2 Tax=Chryseotalea sanaruensis TaxID=2482724 RepID=A0A401U9M5_9BACT|nr:M24 family metallopeptidase [Chryseotalea sanaruensis]